MTYLLEAALSGLKSVFAIGRRIAVAVAGSLMLAIATPAFAASVIEHEASPLAARSKNAGRLFTRMQGNRVGVGQINHMTPAEFFPPFWNGRGMAAGDVNRDGLHDLVLATNGGIRLYLNRGAWQFERQVLALPKIDQASVHVVALADVDNDGWLDLTVTTYANGNFLLINDQGRFLAEGSRQLPGRAKC